jgi:HlyD family secretion protein
VVAEVQADLHKLQNGSLPEEKRGAQAKVEQARARLLRLQHGNRPEEIRQAEGAMNQAHAHFQQIARGLTPEERAEFQARLDVAIAAENEAKQNSERYTKLAGDGAVSQQVMQQAQSAYHQATARRVDAEEAFRRATLGNPKEEVDQALHAYEQAQAAYKLSKEGARSEDVDSARQDLKIAQDQADLVRNGPRSEDIAAGRARLAGAEATLNLLKVGNRKEDIAAAKAQWEAAQAQLASSSLVVKERTIVAATDGTIEKIDIGKGDLIAPSAQVIEMSSADDLWIRVYVPEAELAKIKVGDEASLQVDGINEPLDGVVDSINHEGEFTPANLQTPNERGRQVFGVRLRLKNDDSRVRAGMYATVTKVGRWPS